MGFVTFGEQKTLYKVNADERYFQKKKMEICKKAVLKNDIKFFASVLIYFVCVVVSNKQA